MIAIKCPDCGAPVLWHLAHEHRCVHNHGAAPGQKPQKSKPAKKPTTRPVAKTAASSRNSPSSRRMEPPIDLPALPKKAPE